MESLTVCVCVGAQDVYRVYVCVHVCVCVCAYMCACVVIALYLKTEDNWFSRSY